MRKLIHEGEELEITQGYANILESLGIIYLCGLEDEVYHFEQGYDWNSLKEVKNES